MSSNCIKEAQTTKEIQSPLHVHEDVHVHELPVLPNSSHIHSPPPSSSNSNSNGNTCNEKDSSSSFSATSTLISPEVAAPAKKAKKTAIAIAIVNTSTNTNTNTNTNTTTNSTGIDSCTRMRMGAMKEKKVVRERWICDVCRVEAFDTFEEACAHEDICEARARDRDRIRKGRGGGDVQQQQQQQQQQKQYKKDKKNKHKCEQVVKPATVIATASCTDSSSESSSVSNGIVGDGDVDAVGVDAVGVGIGIQQDAKHEDKHEKQEEEEVDFAEAPILPKKLQFLPPPTPKSPKTKDSTLSLSSSTNEDSKISGALVPVHTSKSMCTSTSTSNSTHTFNPKGIMTSAFIAPIAPKLMDVPCHFENCEICDLHDDSSTSTSFKKTQQQMKNVNMNVNANVNLNLKGKRKSPRSSKAKGAGSGSGTGSPEIQIIETNSKKIKKAKTSKASSNAPTAPLFLKKKTDATGTSALKASTTETATETETIAATAMAPSMKQDQKKKAKRSTGKENMQSTTSTATTDNSKTPRTIAFAAIFKKEEKLSDELSIITTTSTLTATATVTGFSPPAMTEQERKAVLAEHRAAEFASKRRAKQQEERERQAKREENRRIHYESKQKKKEEDKLKLLKESQKQNQKQVKVASIFQSQSQAQATVSLSTASKKRRINSSRGTLASPVDLTESSPTLVMMPTSTKSTKTISKPFPIKQPKQKKYAKENNWKSYPPRFPNPSHLFQKQVHLGDNLSSTPVTESSINVNSYNYLVSTSRYQQAVDSMSQPNLPLYEYPGIGGNDNESDFLFRSFSSIIHPCVSTVEQHVTSQQLWSDKYTMQSVPHDVYGQNNKEVAEDLINFINDWKGDRQQICEARAEKARKLQGRKKKRVKKKKAKRYESDDDDFLSDDEDGDLRNVYLLTGVTGSGKTSLVRATAKHCNCILIEINTTMERGGRALKKEIEECTQSLSNLASRNKYDLETDDESSDPSLALILIDEVDILFESDGDQGFWQSLSSVSKKSRCPIILTASSLPSQLADSSSIQYLHSGLARPAPIECASKMAQIARMEGMKWHKNVNREEIKDEMAQIAKFCGCDLRRIMNEMQLYGLGQSHSTSSSILDSPSIPCIDPMNIIDIEYPMIEGISPSTVKAHDYTVITIIGKHFSAGGEVEVVIGNQSCPFTRMMDENTILAVVPPCQIPDNVDGFGMKKYKTLYEESLATRYASIRLSIRRPNSLLLRSDAANTTVGSSDENTTSKHLIEYVFQDADDRNFLCDSPKVSDEINPKELLEKASKKYKISSGQTNTCSTPIVSCTPIVQNTTGLDEMVQISKHFEMASDFALQKDTNEYLSLPQLAGAVGGSDDYISNDASTSDICGWSSPNSFKGSYDTFVTMPTSRRDRLLISKQYNYLHFFSLSNTEAIIAAADDDDNNHDIIFDGPRSSHEETYVPSQSLETMPNDLFNFKKYHDRNSAFADVGVQRWEMENSWANISLMVEPFFTDTRFIRDITPEYCKVEYLPYLRAMAYAESIQDTNYAALKLEGKSKIDNDFQSKRRTRGSKKEPEERPHYFNRILKTAGFDDDNIGREIGTELARSKLCFSSTATSRSQEPS